ncbi:hypothetical protein [Sphingomonas oryzagri]|uniref:Uncharacterized protein n=1 Tax=Sphingomonas oryzagri TaxID=3042314 RepID=A0ABT6N144_9SPHN|nr:hypothetical protein [Sphingomonas oryzagri]MDH7639023.1 hypothetical protein [Sphingomonas oryzagri]
MRKGLIMLATAVSIGATAIGAAPASAHRYGDGYHHGYDRHHGWDRGDRWGRDREWRHHRERDRRWAWRHHHRYGYNGYYGRGYYGY